MGTSVWNGVPLCSGYQTSVSGKQVILEIQVPVSRIPRVIGNMPDDGPVDEEYDTEAPRLEDEEMRIPAPLRMVTLAIRPDNDETSGQVTGNGSNKFINPMNFYGPSKPKSRPCGPL